MKKILAFVFVCLFFVPVIKAQELVATANHFIELLNAMNNFNVDICKE